MSLSKVSLLPEHTKFPFPLLDLKRSISETPTPPDYIIASLGLVAGTVGSIVAPGASGKSLLALQIAAQVGCGLDLLGLGSPKKGKVLLFCSEDPSDIVASRVHALSKYMTSDQQLDFCNNVVISPCIGSSGNFLDDGTTANKIINSGSENFRLVIIDTLSRWHHGEENERRDAAAVMRQMERIAKTGPAVIFIHHIGKSSDASSQNASRGSSVFVDESRWVAYLKVPPSDKPDKLIHFGVSKSNYSAAFEPILLRRGESGEFLKVSSNKANVANVIRSSIKEVPVDDGDF